MLIAFQQSVCIALGLIALGLITVELRSRFDRSFLYFGAALLLLTVFSSVDLWGAHYDLGSQIFQHVLFCFFPSCLFQYLVLVTGQKDSQLPRVLLALAVVFTLLLFSNLLMGEAQGRAYAKPLYYAVMMPYLVLIFVLMSRFLIVNIRDGAGRNRRLLLVHLLSLVFLAITGCLDLLQMFQGDYLVPAIPSFTIFGVLGMGSLLTFAFADRLVALIRERISFTQKLQDAYGELEKVHDLSEIGRSTAIINHEIKNYTCVISGFAQYVHDRGNLTPAYKDALNRIVEAANKLSVFSNEILDFSKAKVLSDKRPLSIASLIRNCVDANFFGKESSFLFTGFDHAPSVYGDWGKLERVFLNLFRNAFEASAASVKIKLQSRDFVLLVSVEDDGTGCGPEDFKKLFKAFHTTKPNGTGLGLPTSRSIVETHGGHMSAVCKNLLGKDRHGMIFHIAFPTYDTGVRDRKDDIVLVKERLESLAEVIRKFQNVFVNPHVVDHIDDLTGGLDAPGFRVVAGSQVVSEIIQRKLPVQCYCLVTGSDGVLRVAGSPPDQCEDVFSEEFIISRLLPQPPPPRTDLSVSVR